MNAKDLAAVREIFFLSSSRQKFASDEERDKFFALWTDYYFTYAPDLIFLHHNERGEVIGYLMGAADSEGARVFYSDRLKSYAVFADLFARYPGHLHINVHPSGRGQGIGAKLIDRFADELRRRNIKGLHIVTSPDSPNVVFYRRNHFTFEAEREWNEHSLLFMGRNI
jgi:GNAT superfamily N-acetyltransferase